MAMRYSHLRQVDNLINDYQKHDYVLLPENKNKINDFFLPLGSSKPAQMTQSLSFGHKLGRKAVRVSEKSTKDISNDEIDVKTQGKLRSQMKGRKMEKSKTTILFLHKELNRAKPCQTQNSIKLRESSESIKFNQKSQHEHGNGAAKKKMTCVRVGRRKMSENFKENRGLFKAKSQESIDFHKSETHLHRVSSNVHLEKDLFCKNNKTSGDFSKSLGKSRSGTTTNIEVSRLQAMSIGASIQAKIEETNKESSVDEVESPKDPMGFKKKPGFVKRESKAAASLSNALRQRAASVGIRKISSQESIPFPKDLQFFQETFDSPKQPECRTNQTPMSSNAKIASIDSQKNSQMNEYFSGLIGSSFKELSDAAIKYSQPQPPRPFSSHKIKLQQKPLRSLLNPFSGGLNSSSKSPMTNQAPGTKLNQTAHSKMSQENPGIHGNRSSLNMSSYTGHLKTNVRSSPMSGLSRTNTKVHLNTFLGFCEATQGSPVSFSDAFGLKQRSKRSSFNKIGLSQILKIESQGKQPEFISQNAVKYRQADLNSSQSIINPRSSLSSAKQVTVVVKTCSKYEQVLKINDCGINSCQDPNENPKRPIRI